MKLIKNLLTDTRGVAAVELGLILGLLVIGMVTTLSGLGDSVKASFEDTAQKVANAN